MAIIDSLKDKLGNIIYPKTLTKAIYDESTNDRLDITLDEIDDKIGNLSTMTTTEKSNLAGAVSEIKNEVDVHKAETMTKTPFSCTPETGYTIIDQDCYIKNNIAYINVYVKKTDDSNFSTEYTSVVAGVPFNISSQKGLTTSPFASNNYSAALSNSNGGVSTAKKIYAKTSLANTKSILFTGVIIL